MYYLLILQQLIPSLTHIIGKDITGVLPTELILMIRATIASVVFFVWLALKKKYVWNIERKDVLIFLILGFLNIPINQYFFFMSVKLTTAPNISLAYALCPAFVLLISIFFQKQKAGPGKILGIALAIAGAIIILSERGINLSSDFFVGNMIGLAASLAWALYTIIGKPLVDKYGAIFTTGAAMMIGTMWYIPIFLVKNPHYPLDMITTTQWLEIVYLGLIASSVSYALWFFALKKYSASKVVVFNNLQPIITTIMSIFIIKQSTVSPTFILGGVAIILGVFATQKSR